MAFIVWHGTLRERLDLMAAVQHNCECVYQGMHTLLHPCAGHAMLTHDQRALNGLLWIRNVVGRLLAEEGITTP
jgi:hypothetical protein